MSRSEEYQHQLQTICSGFDGRTCWVHARLGIIPGQPATWVCTMQKLDLSGSDVFGGIHTMRSEDGGFTWSEPLREPTLARQVHDDAVETVICDAAPQWHQATGSLLMMAQTASYAPGAKHPGARPRQTIYCVYNAETKCWLKPKALDLSRHGDLFLNVGPGSVQRYDYPGGDILLPVYVLARGRDDTRFYSTVLRCGFDGTTLTYRGHGDELSVDIGRGLCEPSITRVGDRFLLTLRNDEAGYVAESADGQSFSKPVLWRFDDGEALGNYNTQQHWITRAGRVYLVYTRRGLDNDHVFRHRAPLVMAQVDLDHLRIIRETERIIVPERGARLGNFATADLGSNEACVVAAEWMQNGSANLERPTACSQYGSDNSVFIAHLRWPSP